MACSACGDKPQKTSCEFPRAIVEINNAEQISLFRKVVVPTSMGDDTTVPPTIGKYHNVLLNYEANNHTYIYSSDGIPTKVTGSKGEQGPEGPEGRDGRDGAIQYTAGANISIDADNVISATDTTYTAGTGLTLAGTQFSADTSVLQEKLTAGNAIDITSNVISADIYPADYFTAGATVTDTGSKITLNNTIAAPLIDVDLYGDTEQQTYSGKNKIFFNPITVTNNDIAWTVTNDTISASGTATSNWSIPVGYVSFASPLPAGQYTFSIPTAIDKSFQLNLREEDNTSHDMTITAGNKSVTFTTAYTSVSFRFALRAESGTTTNINIPNQLQLEAGSTATDYEPYVGGIPAPNPDYPQDIHVVTGVQTVKVSGKNLLIIDTNTRTSNGMIAKTNANTGIVMLDGTTTTTAADTMYNQRTIEIKSGHTYVLSTNNPVANSSVTLRLFAGGSSYPYELSLSSANATYKFTANADYTCRAQWRVSGTGVVLDDFIMKPMLEEASSASTFEPYQSQSYTIDLGSTELCKIGTYQDYIYKSGDDWYVHKEIGKKVFVGDSSEGWWLQSGSTNEMRAPFSGSITGADIVSNYFHNSTSTTEIGAIRIYTTGYIRAVSNQTSAADFRTWLSTHNTTIYYALATPTDTKIIDADLISDLDALANANSYIDTTYFTVTATGSNLPALLAPTVYRYSAAGVAEVLGVMPDQQVQSDWTQVDTTAVDYIKNKPTLATVATSGSYTDLSNKPTIPAAQIQSDWTQTNTVAKDYIKNKPVIPDVGEMKELTSADYDYPAGTSDGVALWALNDGVYESSSGVKVYAGNGAGQNYSDGGVYIISTVSSGRKNIQVFGSVSTTDSSGRWAHRAFYKVDSSGSVPSVSNEFVTFDIASDLQTTSAYKALGASQGKILNDKITPLADNGAPDTSTVGIIGKIYIDTNTDNAYMCTKVNNGVYTWKQITA